MACPYQYYKDNESYYPRLYCKQSDKYCIYSKRCEKVERYISLDNDSWKECYIYVEAKQKNIPTGSNFVQSYRPNRSGKLFLYVVIDNHVEKISTNLTSIDQDYVYLKEGLDGYEVSLTPFRGTRKK